jgi:uncharacterized membrane protein
LCLLPLIVPWTTVPDARPPLTETVKVVVPLAGTVTKAGKLIRLSPDVVVSASNAMSVALVLGVNFNAANENVWSAPVVFDNVKLKKLTLPKLAESGSKGRKDGNEGRRPNGPRGRSRELGIRKAKCDRDPFFFLNSYFLLLTFFARLERHNRICGRGLLADVVGDHFHLYFAAAGIIHRERS